MEHLNNNATHFFNNIIFDFIEEIDYKKLEILSQLSIKNWTEVIYIDFREALVKLYWAKLEYLKCFDYENYFKNSSQSQIDLNSLLIQSQFEISLFYFVVNVKSCIDQICICLNNIYKLWKKWGDIDIKKSGFNKCSSSKVSNFDEIFSKLWNWINYDENSSLSIVKLRDFWIHQSIPWIMRDPCIWKNWVFPIPAKLDRWMNSDSSYISTDEFLKYHYEKLCYFFNSTLDIFIKNETISTESYTIIHSEWKINFIPIKPSSDITFKI